MFQADDAMDGDIRPTAGEGQNNSSRAAVSSQTVEDGIKEHSVTAGGSCPDAGGSHEDSLTAIRQHKFFYGDFLTLDTVPVPVFHI
jgi:hypothetical protein